jgi:hypothetical protein
MVAHPHQLRVDAPWPAHIFFDSRHYAGQVRRTYRLLRRFGLSRAAARAAVTSLVIAGSHSNCDLGWPKDAA